MSPAPSLEIVRALLKAHSPADAGEADSLKQILALINSSPQPFSRREYDPGHLTASAVVVDPARSRTLLIFHAKLQRWLQPGGHFEAGEDDPSAAASREVLEETGLAASCPGPEPLLLDVDVHPIPARKNEPAHSHYDLRMLMVAQPDIPRAGEVADARWTRPEEFRCLNLDPGLARALKKINLF